MVTLPAPSAIDIKDCCLHSNFPLSVFIDNNTTYDVNTYADLYINEEVRNQVPVVVTGNGTVSGKISSKI